jgi:shikimate dehydrogenase
MLSAAINIFQMIKLGLLGKDISHSRSKQMYEEILGQEIEYALLDYNSTNQIPELPELFNGFDGLSITAPYKNFFIGHKNTTLMFDEYPAINCVHKCKDKNVYELYNTDYLAVLDILESLEREFGNELEVIVLGDGNMAQITSIALSTKGYKFRIISRSRLKADLNTLDYVKLFKKNSYQSVLINCCSREFEFNANIPSDLLFWDQNYDLKAHQEALPALCQYRDGLNLLKIQAREALRLWGLLN